MKRADFGGERYEMTEFQRKVRMNYDKLRDPSWVTVSADGTLDEVQEELYKVRDEKKIFGFSPNLTKSLFHQKLTAASTLRDLQSMGHNG